MSFDALLLFRPVRPQRDRFLRSRRVPRVHQAQVRLKTGSSSGFSANAVQLAASLQPTGPSYNSGVDHHAPPRADWQMRSFSVPSQPFHEQHWRLQEPITIETTGPYAPGAGATYANPSSYEYLQHGRNEDNFGHPSRSTSWADVDRSQHNYNPMYHNGMPIAPVHAQHLPYGHPYAHGDSHQAHSSSQMHYAPHHANYAPAFVPQHNQWTSYGHNPVLVDPSRHDSANTGWVNNDVSHVSGLESNYHTRNEDTLPRERGSDQPD